jgi:hypothetical protein
VTTRNGTVRQRSHSTAVTSAHSDSMDWIALHRRYLGFQLFVLILPRLEPKQVRLCHSLHEYLTTVRVSTPLAYSVAAVRSRKASHPPVFVRTCAVVVPHVLRAHVSTVWCQVAVLFTPNFRRCLTNQVRPPVSVASSARRGSQGPTAPCHQCWAC